MNYIETNSDSFEAACPWCGHKDDFELLKDWGDCDELCSGCGKEFKVEVQETIYTRAWRPA